MAGVVIGGRQGCLSTVSVHQFTVLSGEQLPVTMQQFYGRIFFQFCDFSILFQELYRAQILHSKITALLLHNVKTCGSLWLPQLQETVNCHVL